MEKCFLRRQYHHEFPSTKEGIVKELGQRAVVAELAKATGIDPAIMDAMFRGEYGRREQKAADKKAMADAQRSTAITAVTTLVTLGAAAAVTGPLSMVKTGLEAVGNLVGNAVGFGANTAAQLGATVIKTAVQTIDGSRNGLQGALAGFANGVIGGMTGNLKIPAGLPMEGIPVGLGVNYDAKNGFGAKVGLGGSGLNASVTLSQRGGTQVSAGLSSKEYGVGTSLNYNGADGSFGAGANYSFGESGFNVGANWNSKESFSVSGGYSKDGFGISVSQGRNGFSASSTAAGFNAGTMTAQGFQGANIDWADENLDAAKAEHDKIIKDKMKPAEDAVIKKYTKPPMTDDQINSMEPDARAALLKKIGEQMPDNMAAGTSRTGIEKFFGEIRDNFVNLGQFKSQRFESNAGMIDANGDFHPRTCFTAGTKIRVLKKSVASKVKHPEDIPVTKEFEELVNIEDLRRGDYVLSWNEKTGRQTYSKVTDTYTKKADEIYTLTLQSGEKIETTWNHSFRVMIKNRSSEFRAWSSAGAASSVSLYSTFGQSEEKPDSKNSEWKEARRLKKGDVLFDSTGRQLRIRNVQIEKRRETVYNFTVEGEHDYYVGEDGVLVHNEGCYDAATNKETLALKQLREKQLEPARNELNAFLDKMTKGKELGSEERKKYDSLKARIRDLEKAEIDMQSKAASVIIKKSYEDDLKTAMDVHEKLKQYNFRKKNWVPNSEFKLEEPKISVGDMNIYKSMVKVKVDDLGGGDFRPIGVLKTLDEYSTFQKKEYVNLNLSSGCTEAAQKARAKPEQWGTGSVRQ